MWDETEDPDYLFRTDPCYADRLAKPKTPRRSKEWIWKQEMTWIPQERRVYSHRAKAWFGIVTSDWRQDFDEYRRRVGFPVDGPTLWMPEWWDGWVSPNSLPDW
jgi:hypothetical protein